MESAKPRTRTLLLGASALVFAVLALFLWTLIQDQRDRTGILDVPEADSAQEEREATSRQKVGPERSQARSSTTLRIVDGRTRQPLIGAVVDVVWHDGPVRSQYRSDDEGLVALERSGSLSLLARHEGYTHRFDAWLETKGLPTFVELSSGGTLRVQVRDQDGAPVIGFRGILLPKIRSEERIRSRSWSKGRFLTGPELLVYVEHSLVRDVSPSRMRKALLVTLKGLHRGESDQARIWLPYHGGEWLRQESDSLGIMTWSGIPAGSEVRWGVLENEGRIRIQPAFGKATGRYPPPRNLSGLLQIHAGQTVHSEATVLTSNVIQGRLSTLGLRAVGQAPLLFGKVRCSTKQRTVQANGVPLVSWRFEQELGPGESGRFRFVGVAPGRIRVSGSAKSGNDHWFYCQEFDYRGGLHDLGLVSPMAGGAGTLTIKVKGFDQLSAKIRPRLTVFGKGVPGMSLKPELTLGQPLRFWGYATARVWLHLDWIDTGGKPDLALTTSSYDAVFKPDAVISLIVTDRATWRSGEVKVSFPASKARDFWYEIISKKGGSRGTNGNIIQGRGKIPIANLDALGAIVVRLKTGSEIYGGWHLGVPEREISCTGNGRIEVTLVGDCEGQQVFAVPEPFHKAGLRTSVACGEAPTKAQVLRGLTYPATYVLLCGKTNMTVELKGPLRKVSMGK